MDDFAPEALSPPGTLGAKLAFAGLTAGKAVASEALHRPDYALVVKGAALAEAKGEAPPPTPAMGG